MTSLASSESTATTQSSHEHELSLARAFWLLARLRLTRWKNWKRQGFWRPAPASAASPSRRTATARGRAGLGLLLWSALFIAWLCWQSFRLFEGLAREHGAEGLQGRAALFSSLNVSCVLMMSLLGSRAWDRQGDADAEWLSTLPAPAWVLRLAKIAEAASFNPGGWMMLFPFFTGLGMHAGLGLMAPLVALGICLPLFLSYALLGSVIDVVHRAGSRSATLRVLGFIAPTLASAGFLVWLGALGLERLKLDLLGEWLDFSGEIGWLPFSEPARALLSLSAAPLRGFAWLGLFAAEMAALLGLGALVLRKLYRTDLVLGRSARRGARGGLPAPARFVRQRSLGEAVAAKELLWLRRHPSRSGRLLLNVVLLNGTAMLLVSRAPGIDAAALPGLGLFGVAVLLLSGLTVLLELERPALWQWASLPRAISRVFAHKTRLMAGFSIAGALPIVVYASRSLPSFGQALPALLYGVACIVVLAVFQTALWLRRVSPNAATSPLRHSIRTLQVLLLAGSLGAGFASLSTPAVLVPLFVIAAAFAFTFWHASVEHLPFVLDPSATQPATLTATYGLATIVVTRIVQAQLSAAWIRGGMPPSRAAALSFAMVGVIVLVPSLLWLRQRGVTALRERLGLGAGRGLRVILREGLLWSAPAIAGNLGFWALFGGRLAESTEPVLQQPAMMTLLASSALAVLGVGCVAAPLIEEVLFRGMLYRSLRSGWGIALSLLLSAAVFTVDHPLVAALPVFCGAVCMTLAFERSRSLYAAMLTHAVYNGVIAWIVLSR